jgi:hypothetical protein
MFCVGNRVQNNRNAKLFTSTHLGFSDAERSSDFGEFPKKSGTDLIGGISIVVFNCDFIVNRGRVDVGNSLLSDVSKDNIFGLIGFVGGLVELHFGGVVVGVVLDCNVFF